MASASACPLALAGTSTGSVLANYGVNHCRFAKPTYPGDTLTVSLTAKRKTLRAGVGYDEVVWDAQVSNQKNEVVAAYNVLTMVANRPGVNGAPNGETA